MVVDPWGDIVAQCSGEEGYVLSEIDLDYLYSVRANMDCISSINSENLLRPSDDWKHTRRKRTPPAE